MTNNLQLTTNNKSKYEEAVVSRTSFVVSQRSGQSLAEVIIGNRGAML